MPETLLHRDIKIGELTNYGYTVAEKLPSTPNQSHM
jgi:hypothetical protein